eukprot:364716-Chlamydomonas_euryale.AAC.3
MEGEGGMPTLWFVCALHRTSGGLCGWEHECCAWSTMRRLPPLLRVDLFWSGIHTDDGRPLADAACCMCQACSACPAAQESSVARAGGPSPMSPHMQPAATCMRRMWEVEVGSTSYMSRGHKLSLLFSLMFRRSSLQHPLLAGALGRIAEDKANCELIAKVRRGAASRQTPGRGGHGSGVQADARAGGGGDGRDAVEQGRAAIVLHSGCVEGGRKGGAFIDHGCREREAMREGAEADIKTRRV